MSDKACMYCGSPVAEAHHSKCQWCNVMIAQANCDGVYDRVSEVGGAMQTRIDLSTDDRRAQIQKAYDSAIASR